MPKKIQTLIVVVGEMGMGKTHTAQLIANKTGKHFYEGDNALPHGMKLKSKEAVDDFVKNYLIPAITREMVTHDDVVVAQALYFQEHRELIFKEFKDMAQIKFINVATSNELQLKNLQGRPESFWPEYATSSKPYFQKPPENSVYTTIENSHDELHVLTQINKIFSDFPKDRLVPLQQFFPLPVEKAKIVTQPVPTPAFR